MDGVLRGSGAACDKRSAKKHAVVVTMQSLGWIAGSFLLVYVCFVIKLHAQAPSMVPARVEATGVL